MTVKELIEALQKYDPSDPVLAWDEYSWRPISEVVRATEDHGGYEPPPENGVLLGCGYEG